MAKDTAYLDRATADPPYRTLAQLPRDGVIVWAGIFVPADDGAKAIQLALSKAKHFPCCDAATFASGLYELSGSGPHRSYSVIVRIYFGSRPTAALHAEAQRALDQLKLPSPA